jgi:hypothetical protein
MPPAPAIAAVVLGLISAMVPALFALVAVALSGLRFQGTEWLALAVPAVLALALVVGAVLLLLGRSWLALALPAGALAAVVLAGNVLGGWDGRLWAAPAWILPGLGAVLAALPRVRGWVAARRSERQAG